MTGSLNVSSNPQPIRAFFVLAVPAELKPSDPLRVETSLRMIEI
jgi:hypothetical protein